jgi:lipopolysaccharide transport system permease protein
LQDNGDHAIILYIPFVIASRFMSLLSQESSVARDVPRRHRASLAAHLGEYFCYRELVFNLTVRGLKARYKSRVLGFLWSLLNPLGMMLVFTVVFALIAPDNKIPKYPIFLLCGLLPWSFFNAGLMTGTNSVVADGDLVKQVYFPRVALPLAIVLASLVNFLLARAVFFVVLIVLQVNFSPYLWMLPVVILIQICFIAGIAPILSTLNVFYRDTTMIMEVVMLAWFFLTPVFCPIQMLPDTYTVTGVTLDGHRLMYVLNPMASLISSYRDRLYWGYRTGFDFFLRTAITSVAILVFAFWFFTRFSHRFGEEA